MILKFTITAAADEWTNFTKPTMIYSTNIYQRNYYELIVILYAGKVLADKTESLFS